MKLFWTAQAQRDRLNIIDYIAEDNPVSALKLDDRLIEAAEACATQPNMGIAGEIAGTREFVAHENYRLVYEIRNEGLFVIAVVHTAQQWPPVSDD